MITTLPQIRPLVETLFCLLAAPLLYFIAALIFAL